jgi:hypothetical protein
MAPKNKPITKNDKTLMPSQKKSVFDMHPWPKKKKKRKISIFLPNYHPDPKKIKIKLGCLGGYYFNSLVAGKLYMQLCYLLFLD